MTDTKQKLPEVETYLKALDDARKKFEADDLAAAEKYPRRDDWNSDESHAQRRQFRADRDAAYEVQRRANAEAWNALKESSDPLVKWIAENCGDHRPEATQVLSVLPATADELDELAGDRDWCGVWDQFRDSAEQAGVMPGVPPLSESRKTFLDGVDGLCCRLSPKNRREVNALLDAFLEAESRSETPAPEPADSLAVSA
jgi:hypothetical protein